MEDWKSRVLLTNNKSQGESHAVPRGPRGHDRRREQPRGDSQGHPQLLTAMIDRNGIRPEDVGSAIFSATADLDAEFPALAARQLGWLDVAMLCARELAVPGSLGRCIRVLLHWNTEKPADEIVHVYLKEAVRLRPDHETLTAEDAEDAEEERNCR